MPMGNGVFCGQSPRVNSHPKAESRGSSRIRSDTTALAEVRWRRWNGKPNASGRIVALEDGLANLVAQSTALVMVHHGESMVVIRERQHEGRCKALVATQVANSLARL
jgi:hypothetical protein